MDHRKAYELIGSLASSIDGADNSLSWIQVDSLTILGKSRLDEAKKCLQRAQSDYLEFRKDQGWDTQGEK